MTDTTTGEPAKADPFERVRAVKPAVAYLGLYPILRDKARELGYALALHGSLGRDMDLVAIPWVVGAHSPMALAYALADCVGLYVRPSSVNCHEPGQMPHGRLCYTLVGVGPMWIDLSIMPRLEADAREAGQDGPR